jgi:hypothetical protein
VDVIDELAARLFALEVGARSTAAVTALIRNDIGRWAVGHGWHVRTEARVAVREAEHQAERIGYIDVVVLRGGDAPDLAIEIDSGDKPWSVTKLLHAAEAGMRPVWVRWGDDEWAGWCDAIDVIQLRSPRRPAARRDSRQLQLGLR